MRLLLGGDVMLGRLVDAWFGAGDRSPFDAVLPVFASADLVCVNLECAITPGSTWYTGPRKAFYFRARPWAARALEAAHVRFACLANNHALDAGEPGLLDTLALLEAHGVAWAGAGATLEEASRPALLECQGQRLAFLAYCNHQEDFAATPTRPGIRYLDLDQPRTATAVITADIVATKAHADHVIVALHWQPNYAPVVAQRYQDLAHACLRAGASVVWGHSPHHFQGVELVEGGAVLYSTGDLIDDYAIDPVFRNDRQLIFTLVLEPGGVTRIEALPIEIRYGAAVPADADAHAWIVGRYEAFCERLGTRVRRENGLLVVD